MPFFSCSSAFFYQIDAAQVQYILSYCLLGILITHGFRAVIVKYKWIEKPFENVAIYFFFGILVCSIVDLVPAGLHLTFQVLRPAGRRF